MSADARGAELAASLAAVEARIGAACARAGRERSDLTLVVVTKTFPADDVARLAAAGVREVGESKDQEAAAKAAELAGLGLRWHFVGQLQRNKARSVARYADVVHSVDRAALVRALRRGAEEAHREVAVLVQVDLDRHEDTDGDTDEDTDEDTGRGTGRDGRPPRGGAAPADVPALADEVAAAPGLVLRGLMAVAPRDATADGAARAFERLAGLSARLRADHPGAGWVSAGMSGDLEAAVAAGATHLRVGSAVLGRRPPLQ